MCEFGLLSTQLVMDADCENKFSWDEYKKERCIGKGGFGTVYLCKHHHYNKCVVKEVHVEVAPENEITGVFKEVRILSSLCHPNIIRYLNHAIMNKTLYIVMEYASCGDLEKYIAERSAEGEEREVVEKFAQVVCGLAYLHSRDILHRDICARNVLLCPGEVLKLADFGLSRRIESLSTSGGPVGNPGNFAPELCWGGRATKSSDMWAAGCLFHHLAWGRPPFSSPSLAGTVRLILSSAGRAGHSLPAGYSPDLVALLADLLDSTPSARPSAESLLAKPCLALHLHAGLPAYRPTAQPQEVLRALGFSHLL